MKKKLSYPQWEGQFKKLIQKNESARPQDIIIYAAQTMACHEDGLSPQEVYEKYKGDDLMYNILSKRDKE